MHMFPYNTKVSSWKQFVCYKAMCIVDYIFGLDPAYYGAVSRNPIGFSECNLT
jgi:hypothetical protein